MKTIITIVLTLLATILIYSGIFSNDEKTTFLTQQEQLSLKTRAQSQNTDIMNVANKEELRLLHSRSREIDFNSPHLRTLINAMRKAVIAHHGLGLAAAQIGIPVRVVLMQQPINGNQDFKVYINPVILSQSSTTEIFRESCLSLPDHDDHLIQRSLVLKIGYQNVTGQSVVESLTDLSAAVFQQEMDHLNGVLIMDYPDLE